MSYSKRSNKSLLSIFRLYFCILTAAVILTAAEGLIRDSYAAEESVEQSYALLKVQIELLHQRTLTTIDAMNKAWDEFKKDPSPANEALVNKYTKDFQTLSDLSKEHWRQVEILGDSRSTIVNTIREIMNSTQQTLDSGAEWARGVIPGATWILGVSKDALFNQRWKDTEAEFTALAEKGRDLRKRYGELLSNVQSKLSDTPENREELEKLGKEIEIWKGKMEVMTEIYQFLRADMPGEVIFWHELAGPYVQALTDNVKANLEEILLWDTLGGTSPIERLYKLFKPALQLKLGEAFFSDPVLTDKVRNIVIMDVLFAGADLNRVLKTAELGVGKFLDNDMTQKVTADLLGNAERRAELRTMLKNMSYDRIPAKSQALLGGNVPPPAPGSLENFAASGLKQDELNRIQKVKNSKEFADEIMKIANELLGPALNWSAFQTALTNAKQECAIYRSAYSQLLSAKIITTATYTGVGGLAATLPEDNFVNMCFDDPKIFAGYLEQLKEKNKGVDVAKFMIKETYRKKPVEVQNDEPYVAAEPKEGDGDYGPIGARLKQLEIDLWNNDVSPQDVPVIIAEADAQLWEIVTFRTKKITEAYVARYGGDYADKPDYKAAIAAETLAYNTASSYNSFDTPFYEHYKVEIPFLVGKLQSVKDKVKIKKNEAAMGTEDFMSVRELDDFPIDLMKGAKTAAEWMWWVQTSGIYGSTPLKYLDGFNGTLDLPLSKEGPQILQGQINNLDVVIRQLDKYLNAKKAEKEEALAVASELEEIGRKLGERRSFFIYSMTRGFGGMLTNDEWYLLHSVNVDVAIAGLSDFTDQFTFIYDLNYKQYSDVLERLKERKVKLSQFTNIYSSVTQNIWPVFDEYMTLYKKMGDDGWRIKNLPVNSFYVPLFDKGISSDKQGSTWIRLMLEEARLDNLTQEQIDLITSRGEKAFVQFPGVPPINHPVLRDFVTPSLKRIEEARSILWSGLLEYDAEVSAYRQNEVMLSELRDRLNSMLNSLRVASTDISPSLAGISSLEYLQLINNSIFWNTPLSSDQLTPVPAGLFTDLAAQERGIIRYLAFVQEVKDKKPVPSDIMKYVKILENMAVIIDSEGKGWLALDNAAFTNKYNQISRDAYDIYYPLLQKGQADKDGPIHKAYVNVTGKLSSLYEIVLRRRTVSDVTSALSGHLADSRSLISSHSGGQALSDMIFRLEAAMSPGSDADRVKDDPAVAALIKDITDIIPQLRILRQQAEEETIKVDTQPVKELYGKFKEAYEGRNDSLLISFLGDDWEAGDGTTLSDLQDNFARTFRTFDEINYSLQNMNITQNSSGEFLVSYDVTITSRIYSRNIKHEEKSSVSEIVNIEDGKAKITRTLNGRFWYVE